MAAKLKFFSALAMAVHFAASVDCAAARASAAACALVATAAASAVFRNEARVFVTACHLAASADFAAAAASALLIRMMLARARFADVEASPKAAQNFSVPTSAGIAVLR